jgi:hypothetical protein
MIVFRGSMGCRDQPDGTEAANDALAMGLLGEISAKGSTPFSTPLLSSNLSARLLAVPAATKTVTLAAARWHRRRGVSRPRNALSANLSINGIGIQDFPDARRVCEHTAPSAPGSRP